MKIVVDNKIPFIKGVLELVPWRHSIVFMAQ